MLTQVRRVRSGVPRRQVFGMVFRVRFGLSLSVRSWAPVRPAISTGAFGTPGWRSFGDDDRARQARQPL